MYTLGIAGRSHDPSYTLLRDGEIRVAASLERYSRIKRGLGQSSVVHRAFITAMDRAFAAEGIGWKDIDQIVTVSPATRNDSEEAELGPNLLLGSVADRFLPMPHPSHHLAHAYASFYTSGFDEACALIIDGYGSLFEGGTRESESGFVLRRGAAPEVVFRNTKPERIAGLPQHEGRWMIPPSIDGIGEVYRIITLLLGFWQEGFLFDEPGKTMGLAPYGKPVDEPERLIRLTEDGLDYRGILPYLVSKNLARPTEDGHELLVRSHDAPLAQPHFDLAAKVQREFEEACLHLARRLQRETGMRHLVLGGGCALNSVANNRIAEEAGFDAVYIFPAATDDGTSTGAAYYGYETRCREQGRVVRSPRLEHASLGPRYDDDACRRAVEASGLRFDDLETPKAAAERAGQLLAQGNILGWFQGGAEFGPRSLGHRSILADPRGDQIKDQLNARVKFREGFRPFAPSVLAEFAKDYFELPFDDSPFMLLVCPVRQEHRAMLPGITHVDGTARVQTVNREHNPVFGALISSFAKETGLPIVLNTSFNLKGEPIVETPLDAIRCFRSTEMDVLVIERYVVWAEDVGSLVPRRRPMQLECSASWAPETERFTPDAIKVTPAGAPRARGLAPELLPVLEAADGQRSVQAIADTLGRTFEECKPLVLKLKRLGCIEWVS